MPRSQQEEAAAPPAGGHGATSPSSADVQLAARVLLPLSLLAAWELGHAVFSPSQASAGPSRLSGRALIGVGLAITASVMNALGLNLQRLGQRGTAESASLNTIGIALAASSGILDLVSFGFAPQSLLAPLGSVTLVANLVLAPIMHGERLGSVDITATALVVLGIAITLVNSNASSPSLTLSDIRALSRRPVFLVFIALYLVLLASLAVHVIHGERVGRGQTREVAIGYPLISGMLGGLTILHAKLLTELLKVASIPAHLSVIAPIGLMVAFFAVSQTAVLNRGIGLHSSLFVVPLFSASFLIANLSAGGIFFDEFSSFAVSQLIGFLLGVACVVAGVTALATKDPEDDADTAASGSSRTKED